MDDKVAPFYRDDVPAYQYPLSGYREMSFEALLSRPAWKYRVWYKYNHTLRMEYNHPGLSRINLN